jgi:hypothetical protein
VNREPKHTAAEKPVGVRSTEERQREIRRMLGEPTSERTSPPKTIAKIAKDNSPVAEELKFYLNLEDPIEAAPSIGPKTAEKFTAVKIHTINDFLKMNAEAMADLIDYKRITANVIRTWQDQTRLVCRIPNLRAHDAQLLVGCGIFEPEELATMNPKKLISLVGPFADTKEGLKIIRSGKKPDLEEVTDWINWAKHTRSLQAA